MKNKYKVEVWQGMDGQWYWHISSTSNNKVILTSEGYKAKSGCKKSVIKIMTELVGKDWGAKYKIIELTQ